MLIKLTRIDDNKPVYVNKNMIMSIYEDYNGKGVTVIDCSCGNYFKVTETVEEVVAKLEEAIE